MNAKQIRLHNLKLLIHQWGSAAALAAQVGVDPSQISQIVSPKAVRGLGDRQAEKYEKALGKPAGWMDAPHPEEWSRAGLLDSGGNEVRDPGPAPFGNELMLLQQRLAATAEQGRLTPALQSAIEAVLQLAAATPRPPAARKNYDIHEETVHDPVTHKRYDVLVDDLVSVLHGEDVPEDVQQAGAVVIDFFSRRAASDR